MGNDVEAIGRPSTDDTPAAWRPTLGAWARRGRHPFRVWAPAARSVDLVIAGEAASEPMARDEHGYWELRTADVRPGDRYRYRLDGDRTLPGSGITVSARGRARSVRGHRPPGVRLDRPGVDGDLAPAPDHLRAARRDVFAGGNLCRRRRPARRSGASGRDGDRAHAGGGVPGRTQLGLRRRGSLRSLEGLRHSGRSAIARGHRARVGARGDSRCRLQPRGAGGRVPDRVLSRLLHRTSSQPVGRWREPGRRTVRARARVLHRERAPLADRVSRRRFSPRCHARALR